MRRNHVFTGLGRGVHIMAILTLSLVVLISCARSSNPTTPWQPKASPLSTQWSAAVTATNALPDYPRPQMVRADWQNLNGVWQFSAAQDGQKPPFNQNLPEGVLVPFPIESGLSGIQRHDDRMWYRRTFTVPATWKGRRVLANFGAVDWEARVYINGLEVGTHRGGYDAFSFDITPQLKNGTNEILVGVYDPTDAGGQPLGKQRNNPKDIFYTASSGIWQTVWLEPAPAARITRLDMTPDIARKELRLVVHAAGITGQTLHISALDSGTEVGQVDGAVETELRLPVPNTRLWSPDEPFLYDLKVSLNDGTHVVDSVTSYFGMRSIEIAKVGNVLRPMLNNAFVFQIGTLDQGYWPDGIYTAPTDEALRFDIQKHKELGFNLIRKHTKVEPQRWYYWADKLGVLVWQDMPAMKLSPPTPEAKQEFEAELRALVDDHRNAPSIVMWIPFNEGWGEYEPRRIADQIKQWDPSRLVNNNSGVNCCGSTDGGNGDVVDWHVYVGPETPLPSVIRASVLGEFGGLGLKTVGHEWRPGAHFSYQDESDATALTRDYVGLITKLEPLMTRLGLNAAVYTQITDVETELNGLFTYDRTVLKVDANAVKAAHEHLIDASKKLNP
ncbi:MAG: hypothetical protein NVSMB42_17180 [Herpetosiphon sp.]